MPGLGRSPEEGNGYLTPVEFLGEFHRQRSLAGYRPWGLKESDTTEQLSHTIFIISFLLLTLDFVCSSFSNYFRWQVIISDFSNILRKACITGNVPLRTAFTTSYRFLYGCIFIVICFKVFFNLLFDFLIDPLVFFLLFSPHIIFFFSPSFLFLYLIYSFMLLWSEKMLEVIFFPPTKFFISLEIALLMKSPGIFNTRFSILISTKAWALRFALPLPVLKGIQRETSLAEIK